MPLTFGVTATGSCQSSSQRRSGPARSGSTPRPTSTSGRFGHRASRAQIGRARRRVGHRPGRRPLEILGAARRPSGFMASRADSVRYDTPYGRSMHAGQRASDHIAAFGCVIFSTTRQSAERCRGAAAVDAYAAVAQCPCDAQQHAASASTEHIEGSAGLVQQFATDARVPVNRVHVVELIESRTFPAPPRAPRFPSKSIEQRRRHLAAVAGSDSQLRTECSHRPQLFFGEGI